MHKMNKIILHVTISYYLHFLRRSCQLQEFGIPFCHYLRKVHPCAFGIPVQKLKAPGFPKR